MKKNERLDWLNEIRRIQTEERTLRQRESEEELERILKIKEEES